ncbi:MAG: permease [Anaerolineales bacterium]|nr:permease [Anaerolineales bacterium]
MSISQLRALAFGKALRTQDSAHQTISKTVGLAVFASDSLSSVAYAGGEILLILAALGAASYWLAIPITVAIAGLLIILTFSYRQTIFAYPNGGGAYVVSRDNLGEVAAQSAGAALLIDYVLTVAVSIASGVDQMASIFPVIFDFKVQISLLLIMFHHVDESARREGVGSHVRRANLLVRARDDRDDQLRTVAGAHRAARHRPRCARRASSFRPINRTRLWLSPAACLQLWHHRVDRRRSDFERYYGLQTAQITQCGSTLVWDATLLMIVFLGLGILGYLVQAQPSEQEVLISQVARVVYGDGLMRFFTLLSATIILIMAANTSFADFPRLAALHAGDGFLPRQFTFRGSRLVFSWGVILLAAFASILIIIFQGSVSRLIPLYAIGVFICFTVSQTGMAKRWWRIGGLMRKGELTPGGEIVTQGSVIHFDKTWLGKLILNGFGAVITAIVALIFLVTKFAGGAWIIMILIPTLVWVFFRIHHHYKYVAKVLTTEGATVVLPRAVETIVLRRRCPLARRCALLSSQTRWACPGKRCISRSTRKSRGHQTQNGRSAPGWANW